MSISRWCGRTVLVGSIAAGLGFVDYWLPLIGHYSSCGQGTYTLIVQGVALFFISMAFTVVSPSYAQEVKSVDSWSARSPLSLEANRIPSVMRPTSWLKWIGPGGVGFMAGWALHLNLSVHNPMLFSCSHQLLPIEVVLMFGSAWILSKVGSLLANKLASFMSNQFYLVFLAAGAVLVAATPQVLPIELRANERRALKETIDLAMRQMEYRARHPDRGFACTFKELSVDQNVFKGKNGIEQYYTNGYGHHLACDRNEQGQVADFSILVSPFCVDTCGNVLYCVSGSGRVKSFSRNPAPSIRWGNCWKNGREVALVPGPG